MNASKVYAMHFNKCSCFWSQPISSRSYLCTCAVAQYCELLFSWSMSHHYNIDCFKWTPWQTVTALRSTQVKVHTHKSMTMVMKKKWDVVIFKFSLLVVTIELLTAISYTIYYTHVHVYTTSTLNDKCSHVSVWPLWQLHCP